MIEIEIDEESRLEFEREYILFLEERKQEKRARDALFQVVDFSGFHLD